MTQLPHKKKLARLQRKWANARLVYDSQRSYIRHEISQIHGLIPILMKRRNGGKWDENERAMLQRNLHALSNLSPYMIPLIMPGGVLLLPLLAWWLDYRRKARENKNGSENN